MAYPLPGKTYDPYSDPKLIKNQGGISNNGTAARVLESLGAGVVGMPGAIYDATKNISRNVLGGAAIDNAVNRLVVDRANQKRALSNDYSTPLTMTTADQQPKPWAGSSLRVPPPTEAAKSLSDLGRDGRTLTTQRQLADLSIPRGTPGAGWIKDEQTGETISMGANGTINRQDANGRTLAKLSDRSHMQRPGTQQGDIASNRPQAVGSRGLQVTFDKSTPLEERQRFIEGNKFYDNPERRAQETRSVVVNQGGDKSTQQSGQQSEQDIAPPRSLGDMLRYNREMKAKQINAGIRAENNKNSISAFSAQATAQNNADQNQNTVDNNRRMADNNQQQFYQTDETERMKIQNLRDINDENQTVVQNKEELKNEQDMKKSNVQRLKDRNTLLQSRISSDGLANFTGTPEEFKLLQAMAGRAATEYERALGSGTRGAGNSQAQKYLQ